MVYKPRYTSLAEKAAKGANGKWRDDLLSLLMRVGQKIAGTFRLKVDRQVEMRTSTHPYTLCAVIIS